MSPDPTRRRQRLMHREMQTEERNRSSILMERLHQCSGRLAIEMPAEVSVKGHGYGSGASVQNPERGEEVEQAQRNRRDGVVVNIPGAAAAGRGTTGVTRGELNEWVAPVGVHVAAG